MPHQLKTKSFARVATLTAGYILQLKVLLVSSNRVVPRNVYDVVMGSGSSITML